LELKLKDRHLDMTEVIEAEFQAVLDTLTEHELHDIYIQKKWQKRWGQSIRAEGDYFKGGGGQ
jgi:hypothetical protein